MKYLQTVGLASICLLLALGRSASAASSADILGQSPDSHWRTADPQYTYVMQLTDKRMVLIELAPAFAPRHAAQIAALVKSGWYDGLAIVRVNDNYVTQWGDAEGTKPLPDGLSRTLPAEFEMPRLPADLPFNAVPGRDAYAPEAGFAQGWPVGRQSARGPAWLAHCYGMVGAGRDSAPDSGGAGELYAVIGHSPRHLDRNITVVGRVLLGMEYLAALPRGDDAMGFYATPAQRVPIVSARLLSQLPDAGRPVVQVLRTDSSSYARWLEARRNRTDSWFVRPAGAIDLCNAMPPVRLR